MSAKIAEALRSLLHYVGDGKALMLPETVKRRNGRVDEDASSANIEHNENVADAIRAAREALADADRAGSSQE